jgi:hypothetical protein
VGLVIRRGADYRAKAPYDGWQLFASTVPAGVAGRFMQYRRAIPIAAAEGPGVE